MNSKCLLCGTITRYQQQHQLRSKKQSKILTEWGRILALSLCQILELDHTFESIFRDASFCVQCQEIVCSAEFTISAISRLQRQLGFIRESIKSLLRSNYHGRTANPYPGSGGSAYNIILERIVSRMGAVTKVEPEPPDGMETGTTVMDSNDDFIISTLEPPSPRQVRLTALKRRQTLMTTDTRNNVLEILQLQGDNWKSLQTKTECAVGEFTAQLEDITATGSKGESSLKITEDVLEESLSSGDLGVDHGNRQDSPESEAESEKNVKTEGEIIDANKKIEIQTKGGHERRPKPSYIKFTCNYESCVGEQLTFRRPRQVKVHLESLHGGEGLDTLYHCAHCPHRTTDMEKLRLHYLVHKDLRPRYPCGTCDKEFLTLGNARKHQVSCSKRKARFMCTFCRKRFSTAELRSTHLALHSAAESPFDCALCPAKLKNKLVLIQHVRNVHEGIRRPTKSKNWIGTFPCNFPPCLQNGSKFNRVLDMKRHLADEHGQAELAQALIYHCIQCESRFKVNRNLELHLAENHGAIKEVTKDNLCSICGKLFSSIGNLRNHLRDFHTELRMKPKCHLCTKSCDSQQDLVAHEQLHSSQTPYACVLCSQTFVTTMDLHRHVYNTHELLPFKCQEEGCGKGFERKHRLDWHMKATHGPGLSERPHQCPHCPFGAWSTAALKHHVRSHTQEKRYRCVVAGCEREYVWKAQLSRHVRLDHEDPVLRFACKTCGRGFRTLALMKRHEPHHSDFRPFACQVCSARFKVPKNLKQHMKCHEKSRMVKGARGRPRKSRDL